MRVSLLQGFNQSLENMLRIQEQTFRTQNQLSTGRRILTPSDDPVASAQLVRLNQEQAQTEQFISNINIAENRLTAEEIRLSSVNDILLRTRELIVQAGNLAVNNQSERRAIASELSIRLDELVDLANARDSNGEYIFAGFQGNVEPFTQNPDGSYSYQGDDGQRRISISGGSSIPINDSGRRIFENIESVRNSVFTTTPPGNLGEGMISAGVVTDQAAYDAVFPEDFRITFDNFPAVTYEISRESDNVVIGSGTYVPGDPIAFNGVEVIVTHNPIPPQNGDSFVVNSQGTQSILTTLSLAAEGLNSLTDSPADVTVLEQLISDTLNDLDSAEQHIGSVVSEIGARLNTLDSVQGLQENISITNQEVISELQDLDYAEAISRLSIETFTLEAAQQSFARIK